MTQRPDFAAYGRRGAKIRLRRLSPRQRSEIAQHAHRVWYKKTTKEQRREIARKAVLARWARVKARKKTEER
jgi:hypothetical protein